MDKRKVIKGLTQCSTYWNQAWGNPDDCPCNKCPYKRAKDNCRIALSADALKVIVAYEKALVPLNVKVDWGKE